MKFPVPRAFCFDEPSKKVNSPHVLQPNFNCIEVQDVVLSVNSVLMSSNFLSLMTSITLHCLDKRSFTSSSVLCNRSSGNSFWSDVWLVYRQREIEYLLNKDDMKGSIYQQMPIYHSADSLYVFQCLLQTWSSHDIQYSLESSSACDSHQTEAPLISIHCLQSHAQR